MSLKPSTRHLIACHNKRATKIWHNAVGGGFTGQKKRTLNQAMDKNKRDRKHVANTERMVRASRKK